MATNYPTSLDTSSTTLRTDIASTDDLDASGKEHDLMTNNVNAAAIAVETKVGTGSSTAVTDSVLAGTGAGTSAWTTAPTFGGSVTSAGLTVSGAVACADQVVGRPELKDYAETVNAIGNTAASQAVDLESGNVVTATLAVATTTFTFSNPSATGKSCSFTLILSQDATGSRTVTWPASVKWAGGTAPTLTTTASRADVLTFSTVDAGTIWYGFVAGQDFS